MVRSPRLPSRRRRKRELTASGRVSVYLPHDFHGAVTGHTKAASVKVSPGLAPRAVLAPSPPGAGRKETRQTWLVAPIGTAALAQHGPDRVWAQTKNAGVRFRVEGEKGDDDVWGDIAETVLGEVLG